MRRFGHLPLGDELAVSGEPLMRTLARLTPIRVLLNWVGWLG